MREIKFRAWDIPKKRMLPVVNLQFRLDYREDIDGAVSGVSVQGDGSEILLNYELMQYIGMEDKKGREIYEGDIVKFVEDDGKKTIGIVEMGKKNLAWSFYLPKVGTGIRVPMLNFIHNMLSLVPDYDFEIIGNIYENPELLK